MDYWHRINCIPQGCVSQSTANLIKKPESDHIVVMRPVKPLSEKSKITFTTDFFIQVYCNIQVQEIKFNHDLMGIMNIWWIVPMTEIQYKN